MNASASHADLGVAWISKVGVHLMRHSTKCLYKKYPMYYIEELAPTWWCQQCIIVPTVWPARGTKVFLCSYLIFNTVPTVRLVGIILRYVQEPTQLQWRTSKQPFQKECCKIHVSFSLPIIQPRLSDLAGSTGLHYSCDATTCHSKRVIGLNFGYNDALHLCPPLSLLFSLFVSDSQGFIRECHFFSNRIAS